ncbi:thioredoxin [Rhizoctonia solani 123E]|uniref:Thioredoxin n=1 Tax=Rhizoctonia solani 123E TaxID=1423351 RepID=A0A074SBL2_9AGAM|nr:thioredoxin [Rhizoctonia solani 123E]
MSDRITHIGSKAQHDDLVAKNPGKIMVVDFHAAWCGPCHMIAPKYETLANECPEIIFTKVDVDAVPELSQQYGIRAMPTFKVVKDGEDLETLQGANAAKLEALIEKYKA